MNDDPYTVANYLLKSKTHSRQYDGADYVSFCFSEVLTNVIL